MAASEADRRFYAKVSWGAEFVCLLTTALYVVILAHDFSGEKTAAERWCSASWYKHGFCVSNDGQAMDSHHASFWADIVISPILVLANAYMYYKKPSTGKTILLVAAVGAVFHGLAHLEIHDKLQKEGSEKTPLPSLTTEPLDKILGRVFFAVMFLAIGPWLGKLNRVPAWFCLIVHLIFSVMFAEGVPEQYGFATVLAYINGWVTISRICNIGCTKPEDVAMRNDDGWFQTSMGSIIPVPIIFSELMGCDAYFKSMGGHFWYDFSLLLIMSWQTFCFWRTLDADDPKKVQ